MPGVMLSRETSIQQTKLHRPSRTAALLRRPRLLTLLDAASQRTLTVIASAPGSGKSSLVNQWLDERGTVAAWLQLDSMRWAILILTAMLVFAAEFFNTAVEAIVDLVSPEHHPLAKIAKDVAAAAVLVGACGAVLIGLLLMGPPLLVKLQGLLAR